MLLILLCAGSRDRVGVRDSVVYCYRLVNRIFHSNFVANCRVASLLGKLAVFRAGPSHFARRISSAAHLASP